jgi:threonine aldolase
LKVHLDGARIFNASVALGKPVAELTRKFDSVMFCLSKGLGAPVGSLLVGSKEFITAARGVRKALGGGMRQAGILAAAGLIALEQSPSRLHEDHANAKFLAEGLGRVPGIKIDIGSVQTNILIFDVTGTAMTAQDFTTKLGERNILAGSVNRELMRFVTHCDVNRADCQLALEAVEAICAATAHA